MRYKELNSEMQVHCTKYLCKSIGRAHINKLTEDLKALEQKDLTPKKE